MSQGNYVRVSHTYTLLLLVSDKGILLSSSEVLLMPKHEMPDPSKVCSDPRCHLLNLQGT